ncbi:MAG: T9SS type A sorting domain-containing protein [Chitinophagales bacterium]
MKTKTKNGYSGLTKVMAAILMWLAAATTFAQTTPQLAWSGQVQPSGDIVPVGIRTDAQGNSYVTGKFKGTVDLDPGAAVASFTGQGTVWNTYVAKFNNQGQYMWGKVFVCQSVYDNYPTGIELTPSGKVWVTGGFRSRLTVDNPTRDLIGLAFPSGNTAYPGCQYFVRLQNNGAYDTAMHMQGASVWTGFGASYAEPTPYAARLDKKGNLIITGKVTGAATASNLDIDFAGPGTANFLPGNFYLAKYDSNFTLLMHKKLPFSAANFTVDQVECSNDTIFIQGMNDQSSFDFNGGGAPAVNPTNNGNYFTAAYRSSNLSCLWAFRRAVEKQRMALHPTGGLACAVQSSDILYDIDPSVSTYNLNGELWGLPSVFIAHYDEGSGALITSGTKAPHRAIDTIGGNGYVSLGDIGYSATSDLFVSGTVVGNLATGRVDFNFGSDTLWRSHNAQIGIPNGDFFIAAYNNANTPLYAHIVKHNAYTGEGMYNLSVISTNGVVISGLSQKNGLQMDPLNIAPVLNSGNINAAIYAKYTFGNCAITASLNSPDTISSCRAFLTVSATSATTPLQYQWYRDGIALSGQNSATINNDTLGTYQCQISNSCGSVWAKKVTVLSLSAYSTNHFYKLDGNANDEIVPVNGAATVVSYAKNRNGVDNSAAVFNGTTSVITVTAPTFGQGVSLWFKRSSLARRSMVLASYQQASPGNWNPVLYLDSTGKLCGFVWPGSGNPIYSSAMVNDTLWHHAAWTYDAATAKQYLYFDGTEVGNRTSTALQTLSSNTLKIGNGYLSTGFPNISFTGNNGFEGVIDNVLLTGTLKQGNVQQLYHEIELLSSSSPNPPNGNVCAGSPFSLSVNTQGATAYQWQLSSTNLSNGAQYSGVNTANLNVTSAPLSNTSPPFNQPIPYVYNVIASNNYCVSNTYSFFISGINSASGFLSQPVSQSACIGTNAFFAVRVNAAASFIWKKNGAVIPNSNNDTLYINNVSAADFTTYTCEITGCNGATVVSNVVSLVQATGNITITAQPQAQTKCAGQPVNFSVATTGGTVTYQWRKNGVVLSGQTAATLNLSSVSISDTGSYSCDIIGGSCGTISSAGALLQVSSSPIISFTPASPTVCAGSSVTITANGGTSYSWSNGGGSSAAATFSPTTNATYTVTATANSCSATANVSVSVNSLPAASVSPASISICAGKSTTLTASGGNSYSWSNALGSNSAVTVNPSSAATYTVTVTGTGNCTATATASVSVNANPVAAIVPAANAVCAGQSVQLTATGGGTYAWSNGLGSNAIQNVSPITATSYSVTVSNAANCTATASVNIGVNAVPSVSISGNASICAGQSVTLTASGSGTAYSWSNSGGTAAAATFNPTGNTTYTVTATANNCSASASKNVTVTSVTAAISGPSAICTGTSATLNVISNGTAFSWSTGATTASINIQPTTATTYSVTATLNGCSATASQQVTVQSSPAAAISGASGICSGNSTALTASGGGTYLWSTGANTASINVTPSTNSTYSVTVTLGANCTATASKSITVKQPTASQQAQTICAGTAYSFHGKNLTASGTYKDTLTNVAGCDSVITLLLTVTPPKTSNISQTICFGSTYNFNQQTLAASGVYRDTVQTAQGCDSIITLTLNISPQANYQLSAAICSGQSYHFGSKVLTVAGVYRDTLQTALGCDSFITLTLTVNTFVTAAIDAAICSGSSYTFGGKQLNAAGVYTDTLLSSGGCDSIVTLSLSVHPAPQPVIVQNGVDLSTQQFDAYQWQLNGSAIGAATSAQYTAIQNGSYTVLVTDSNSCQAISGAVLVTNVGIKEAEVFRCSIHPNPASTDVLIQVEWEVLSNATLSVINAEGQLILEQPATTSQYLNVSHWPAGLYNIRISHASGEVNKRLVKQ